MRTTNTLVERYVDKRQEHLQISPQCIEHSLMGVSLIDLMGNVVNEDVYGVKHSGLVDIPSSLTSPMIDVWGEMNTLDKWGDVSTPLIDSKVKARGWIKRVRY